MLYYLCAVQHMKRSIAAILLTLYIAFSCGVVINLHYCMDQFDSLQLGTAKSDTCGKCGMPANEKSKCCHIEVKIFKILDDQQASENNFRLDPAIAVISEMLVFDNKLPGDDNFCSSNNHSPPLSKQYTYLQNCVFRI